jgi:predicted metal-dependent hydrolase
MQKELEISGKKLQYTLKTNKRSRYMRLAIYPNGTCAVTTPVYFDQKLIEKFLIEKSAWIFKKFEYFSNFHQSTLPANSKTDYKKYKQSVLNLVNSRLNYFNQFYVLTWNRISIRNSKTRWGSCSRKGNLNFSYRLHFVPIELLDYVIVHELSHLKEFNHSIKFWQLVSKTIPDYKQRRKQLKLL